ncbi:hypothetical protein [Aestuariivita boseongensis]|uniref:hypothetical protein n=1 Tax=Aestuariivita boseongensis TaxID=1470562 RepID=UPI0009E38663|nr:hypothetical protein [Aestuariivita boseongensis]
MSSLKTLLMAGLAATTPLPVWATSDIHYVFAGCVGRFSAEMEHAWLLENGEADRLRDKRHSFLSLMEASMPVEKARAVLSYRIDNKMAHAALLTTASFDQDARRAQSARAAAQAYRNNCERLLLDS